MCGDINSQIREVVEVEITGKRKKGRQRKSWEECIKENLEQYGLRKKMRTIERNGESKLEQKLPTPASRDNAIKTDVVVDLVIYHILLRSFFFRLYSSSTYLTP